MRKADRAITELVRTVRRRYRRRAILQGTAVTVLVLLLCLTILLLVYTGWSSNPVLLVAGGMISATLVLWMAVRFVLRPGMRTLSDEQIALYVEEKIPGLEDRLNSAVEAGGATGRNVVLRELLEDAARQVGSILPDSVVDRLRERLLSGAAALCVLAFVIFGFTSLDKIRFAPTGLTITGAQSFMTIAPGNVEVERGDTQRIVVTLAEEANEDVVIVYREGDEDWSRAVMRRGLDARSHLQEFFDIQQPIDYFVEVGKTRSDPYRIAIYVFPAVDQIDVTYHYPDYTGLPARTEENAGDIRGLLGSTVEIRVQTIGTVQEAVMDRSNGSTIVLKAMGSGAFRGSLKLAEEDLYTIRLTDARNKQNRFPDQHRIVPVPDEKPRITLTDPGRDTRANAVEEVLVAADAQDDFGVVALRLVYSVNGEDEQSVDLMLGSGDRSVSGEHLFFLEDYMLEPGDIITYYVEARDGLHATAEATDMYFIEVIPFDQNYTQINNAGANQSAQRQSGLVLSQQDIIAATWKLLREREDMDAAEFAESVTGLSQAQANLKANIEERINSTAFSLELRGDSEQQQVVEHLRKATEAMAEAVRYLHDQELKQALTPERRALNHLLRADALNKENQVARQQGGRGGGMSATEERMTELMDLELDISKDKYEVQQQRSEDARGEALNETLQKVKELAQRQQSLADRNQPDQLAGEDRKRFVDRLKRDQDDLRNQVESLSRDIQQSGGMQGRLDQTMRNMQEAERALREGDMTEALRRQQQALNELDRLRQDLQRAMRGSLRERVESLAEDLESLQQREQSLGRSIDEAREQGRLQNETLDPMEAEREELIHATEEALDRAEGMQQEARAEDAELATTLRNLIQQAERDRLLDRMLDSRQAIRNGWMDSAARIEEDILASLERLEGERRALESSLPVTEEETLARTLDDLRNLEAELQQLEAQASRMRGAQEDRQGRAAQARMQSQMERIRATLGRLQEESGGQGGMQQALAGIQRALTRADHTGVLLDEESAKSFFDGRIYDPLSQLEVTLARQLDAMELEKKLYGSRKGDVPPEYRDMVEKYYERLSKSQRRIP